MRGDGSWDGPSLRPAGRDYGGQGFGVGEVEMELAAALIGGFTIDGGEGGGVFAGGFGGDFGFHGMEGLGDEVQEPPSVPGS